MQRCCNIVFLTNVILCLSLSHSLQDGMVEILQKCLQQYSGVSILRARKQGKEQSSDSAVAKLFDRLLEIDSNGWDAEIRSGIKADDLSPKSLIAEIQKTMETVVLGLENGSMAQRVQAEYLRELVSRVESIDSTAS